MVIKSEPLTALHYIFHNLNEIWGYGRLETGLTSKFLGKQKPKIVENNVEMVDFDYVMSLPLYFKAMMDRKKKHELPKMQVGFIDAICMPLYEVGSILYVVN